MENDSQLNPAPPPSMSREQREQVYQLIRNAGDCLSNVDKTPIRNLVYDVTGCHSLFSMSDGQCRMTAAVAGAVVQAYERGEKAAARAVLTVPEAPTDVAPAALAEQVGGTHYKQFSVQPSEIAERNNLTFLEGSAIKRLHRHSRGGKGLEDLRKAVHEIRQLAAIHYNEEI